MPDAVSEQEIAAVFERLREEVRRAPRGPGDPPVRLPIRLTARQEAERLWPVTADRPLQRRAGPIEIVLRPIRLVLRKAMRWYVEPALADQREFNAAVLELVDDLAERTSAGLARLEQALPASPDLPDAGPYAADLRGAAPLLTCDDPAALDGLAAGSVGGIVFLAPGPAPSEGSLARLLEGGVRALRPGGILVAEAGGSVSAERASAMAGEAGFARADVRFGAGPHGYALLVRR